MEKARITVQSKLAQLTSVHCGIPIPDGMVEEGETYFGYDIQEVYQGKDFDNNYVMEIVVFGKLVRLDNPTENTIAIMDKALEDIKEQLKSLNFSYNYRDITIDSGIRRIQVTASAKYYEKNNELIR